MYCDKALGLTHQNSKRVSSSYT